MEQPPVIIAVIIVLVFLIIGVWLPLTFFLSPNLPRARARGIRFYFSPMRWLYFRPAWAKGFNTAEVEMFVDAYAEIMPEAYAAIDVAVTSAHIKKHAAKVKCVFTRGALRSAVHERLGLTDMNGDGKPDKLTGLTHSETLIQIGVLDEMIVDGKVDIAKTAFSYELHNAFIQRFAGYPVAAGESHVAKDDERLLPWLEGKKMADMKTLRRVLDEMWKTIK